MFNGLTPSMRESDPEFFRFETRLYFQYIAARFVQWQDTLIQAFNEFGKSMQTAAESMRKVMLAFNKKGN